MRIIFIILLFCTSQLFAQSKIYDIEMQGIDSSRFFLKDYTGNKLLITIASLESIGKGQLRILDSIQDKYSSVKVLVIPSQETISQTDRETIMSVRNNPLKRAVFFTPTTVAKDKASEKNKLIKHLTDVKENGHFDVDTKSDFLMFLVSESGFLYAVIDRLINAEQLDKLLTQKDVTQ